MAKIKRKPIGEVNEAKRGAIPPPPPPPPTPKVLAPSPPSYHILIFLVAFVVVLLARLYHDFDPHEHLLPSRTLSLSNNPPPCSQRTGFQYDPADESLARGLHLVCVHKDSSTMTVYPHTLESKAVQVSSLNEIRLDRKPTGESPIIEYAIFSANGEKVYTEGPSSSSPSLPPGLHLLFEGGVFVWPGVRKGFSRRHPTLPLVIRTLSLRPLVLEVEEDFISPPEIALIKVRMDAPQA